QLGTLRLWQLVGHVFERSGERVERGRILERLRVVPGYLGLCDSVMEFLRRGNWLRAVDGGWSATEQGFTTETRERLADFSRERDEFARAFPALKPHAELLWTSLDVLPRVLAGEVPATDVLFPGGSIEMVTGIYRGSVLT